MKEVKTNLIALRLPVEVRKQIPKGNASAFIKEAIEEKIERQKGLKTCPACKGRGRIRR